MIKIIQLVFSFIGAIVALFIAHKFNIFEHMDFIPVDKAYDACITVYFAIAESLIKILGEHISGFIKAKQTEVQLIFYSDKNNISLGSNPKVRFNDLDVATINVRVFISGKVKSINGKKIMIYAMSQMDYQVGNNGSALSLDSTGNIVIDLKKMCGNQDEVQLSEDFSFLMQRSVKGENETIISSDIGKEDCFLKYYSNKAKIIMGDKE